jgi:hypothetical protein
VQDTAEQVLARLERYAASLPAPRPVRPLYRTGMPFAIPQPDVSSAAASRVTTLDTLVPSRAPTAEPGTRFVPVAIAVALATLSCGLTTLLFVVLDPGIAIVAALTLILGAVIGQLRRVPFAGAWTAGLAVAVFLVRFS